MLRACVECGKPSPNPRCPQHQRLAWQDSPRKTPLPRNWDKLRKGILARDPICCVCNDALSVEVDHIVPGSDHRASNLQGICRPCHKRKTQREALAARTSR